MTNQKTDSAKLQRAIGSSHALSAALDGILTEIRDLSEDLKGTHHERAAKVACDATGEAWQHMGSLLHYLIREDESA